MNMRNLKAQITMMNPMNSNPCRQNILEDFEGNNMTISCQQRSDGQVGSFVLPVDDDLDWQLRRHTFTHESLRAAWPLKFTPPECLSSMNVEETAIWMEMLCGFKGWVEGKTYSDNFAKNEISGHMLHWLDIVALRDELGIEKFGNRLEILAAIKHNELTLMNPVTVSIHPNVSFVAVTSRRNSGGLLCKENKKHKEEIK